MHAHFFLSAFLIFPAKHCLFFLFFFFGLVDHAGWTSLHEACNHGSTACVEALLHHHPAPVLNSQVGGISPLHDALLNGHMDIAKMLLEHAGGYTLPLQPNIQGLSWICEAQSASFNKGELIVFKMNIFRCQ